jgi:hypothetical protein
MLTYQDFLKVKEKNSQELINEFILNAISQHQASEEYKISVDATNYDKQKNTTIMEYVKYIYSSLRIKSVDKIASNNKICSNFFHRLNTQRNEYSLGNGVEFVKPNTKDLLGTTFDNAIKKLGYKSLIHGLSFGFWNLNKLEVFTLLEFVPLWDEETSNLRGGIRFWQLDADKPLFVRLYEEDGVTKFKKEKGKNLEIIEPKQGYVRITKSTAEGGIEGIEFKNYKNFPIIPMWGSELHQSTLVGMRGKIDAYDLIRSGFANDLEDCAEIYWIINNASGMDARDISELRAKLKLNHVAQVDDENSSVVPYTQDIPSDARSKFLEIIRNGIYEDFGGLDVHTISATSTNDHIDAAYQPLDEEADDFEYQLIEFIHNLLDLLGIEDDPIFKRNRISNQKEQTEMVLSASEYLDEKTILQKLPFISIDEVDEILKKKDEESAERFGDANLQTEPQEDANLEEDGGDSNLKQDE